LAQFFANLTLYPLIRPGAFVQIDVNQRRVISRPFHSLEQRPVYFVELRDGYVCSWCERKDNVLLLVPHPLSPVKTRQLAHPHEGEIVGQVTGVVMRLPGMALASEASVNR
jgi:hypothetical protein